MGQLCTAHNNWYHAKSVESLVSTAVIEWSDIIPSSIITTHLPFTNHTVAFVGTTQGDLVKVRLIDILLLVFYICCESLK